MLPVGMLIESHMIACSFHSVLGTFTMAGEITKLVKLINPQRTAVGGTQRAFPI